MSDETKTRLSAVVNASPLISLAKAGLEYIFPEVFSKIIVPGAVWSEVTAYKGDIWRQLFENKWLKRATVQMDTRIFLWNLGRGESEVLSWAIHHPDHIAVIDDRAARKCASSARIGFTGTAGCLVLAYRLKIIPSLEAALNQIRETGLYLTDDLIRGLLEKADS